MYITPTHTNVHILIVLYQFFTSYSDGIKGFGKCSLVPFGSRDLQQLIDY